MEHAHHRPHPHRWLAELTLAVIFLTRIPLSLRHGPDTGMQARCMGWFPLVGAGVGLAGGGVFALAAALHLPATAAALLALGAMAMLTGALHEDGLADLADGLGGGRTRDRALEIMRDSRIGTFGGLALVLVVGLRASALASLADPAAVAAALMAAGAASRAPLAVIVWVMEPARKDGLAATQGYPPLSRVVLGLALACGLALAVVPPALVALVALAAAAGAAGVALLALRRLKGHTGDVLGAAQQAGETAVLLALSAVGPVWMVSP